MSVQELIDLLSDCDPDAEALLAHQPGWPLEFTVLGVNDAGDDYQPWRDRDNVDCQEGREPELNDAVYLVATEGHPQVEPYAPRSCWDSARQQS